MRHDIYNALYAHIKNKGYSVSLMMWIDTLTDDLYGAIKHLVEEPTQKEEFVTIGGVQYKLEEIKK